MKKIYSLLTVLTIVMGAMVITSCERGTIIIDGGGGGDSYDRGISRSLEGTWLGDMHIVSYWGGVKYKVTESEITFRPYGYNSTRGDGYWVDFYSGCSWDYVAYHIKWEVYDREIIVDFIEDGYRMYISDFIINKSYFEGYIDVDRGESLKFNLRKISNPYRNWDYYDYGWGYWDSYAKGAISEDFSTVGDSTQSKTAAQTQDKPIRMVME